MSNIVESSKATIEALKKEGYSVAQIKIAGRPYIYRSVTRAEYRSMQEYIAKEYAALNLKNDTEPSDEDKLKIEQIREDSEYKLASECIIYPEKLRLDNMPAGDLAVIVDSIMQLSGFGSDIEPEIL